MQRGFMSLLHWLHKALGESHKTSYATLKPDKHLIYSEIAGWHSSTPFKLDLLSASKYGTPATGARCNEAQRCWIPSNDVTRKVTEAFLTYPGVPQGKKRHKHLKLFKGLKIPRS